MKVENHNRLFIALSGAIVAQSIAALFWAGAAAERLSQLELRVDRSHHLVERTARLEEQVVSIHHSVVRIERKLDDVRSHHEE